MQKFYCYVDETGQDTKGKFFLVSVVVTEKNLKNDIEERLMKIEKETGKQLTKWHAASFERRKAYLEAVLQIRNLRDSIFYATYQTTKEYTPLTTYTIAKVINTKTKDSYQAIIIIDGLNEKERQRVARGLRQLRIKYGKVRGSRDEASPLIRLADALAGFLRDREEKQNYTQVIFEHFISKHFLTKIE